MPLQVTLGRERAWTVGLRTWKFSLMAHLKMESFLLLGCKNSTTTRKFTNTLFHALLYRQLPLPPLTGVSRRYIFSGIKTGVGIIFMFIFITHPLIRQKWASRRRRNVVVVVTVGCVEEMILHLEFRGEGFFTGWIKAWEGSLMSVIKMDCSSFLGWEYLISR